MWSADIGSSTSKCAEVLVRFKICQVQAQAFKSNHKCHIKYLNYIKDNKQSVQIYHH